MAVDESELQGLRSSYQAQTGEEMNHFMCPITVRDEETELCDGHILSKAFEVSQTTVLQRADIDNYYGHTIERSAILRFKAEEALDPVKMSKQSECYVMTLDGEHVFDAGFINDKTQVMELRKLGRKIVYLTDGAGMPMKGFHPLLLLDKDAVVPDDARFTLRLATRPILDGEVEGAMLRSAYLAHFRMRSYSVLKDAALAPVRIALSEFFARQGKREDAHIFFNDFVGCVSLVPIPSHDFPDTLSDNVLLFHYVTAPPEKQQSFAQSCIFRILKNELTIVTLPMSTSDEGIEYYRKLLRREHFEQCVRFTQWRSSQFITNPMAYSWQY